MGNKTRIGIVGVGRMGSLHTRFCAGLESAELAVLCDVDESHGRETAEKLGCAFCTDFRELTDAVDAVIVSVPTKLHREIGGFFLNRGIATLIEKPLAGNVEDSDALLESAEKGGAVLQVGHVERFNPAVSAVEKMVVEPRFIDCRRISPFSFRSTDVGVVLDVMIHDIDIILYLCKSKVKSIDAVGVKVLSSAEDIANARIVFENGCVADVTASRVSVKKERQIRIFQHDSYISLDYEENRAKCFTRQPGAENVDVSSLDPSSVGDPLKFVLENLISVKDIKVAEWNPLERELKSFVECVRTGGVPAVTGEDGKQAVAVAESIRQKMED